MEKEVCKLCNRKFNYNYNLFGRSCLNNEYKLLGIKQPKKVKNKELYLCNQICKRTNKIGLNKVQKNLVTEKYLTLQYLQQINYGNAEKEEEKIMKDIENVSSKKSSLTLNQAYKMYKTTVKFDNSMEELKSNTDNSENIELLKKMKFIFDTTKIKNPALYIVYYHMQYSFWENVVIGGILVNMKLSARLMQNSLSKMGGKADDMVITDEETVNQIINSEAFKQKVKMLIDEYAKNQDSINIKGNDRNYNIEFDKTDLFLSIHGATINIEGTQNNDNSWNLKVKIIDTYDFTDLKDFPEYFNSNDSMIMSIFSTILNNFAVVSMQYGVLKSFKVNIEFELKNYNIEG